MAEIRYPSSIQTFSEIIRDGYLYVDKTELMWRLQRLDKYIFLSRPRRFGKTVLSTTFRSFFRGEKELFAGLKVMELEKEWTVYPVIHLNLSTAKDKENNVMVQGELMRLLKPYVELYGSDNDEITPGSRLAGLIERAYKKTGKQVVIIIDEYDAPLLEKLYDDELKETQRIMQEFYQPLKAYDEMIRFCFITGITKFSQLSIFSTINNLTNVTMVPQFATICGFTDKDIDSNFAEGIRTLSETYGCTSGEMRQRLRNKYDGYHFSEDSEGVYNPFSLLKAFNLRKVDNYWFGSGTPSFLIRHLQHFNTDITSLDNLEEPAEAFDLPTERMETALPLLYQSGYLTIKDYDLDSGVYTLDFPNQEVRVGYASGLLPTYAGLNGSSVQTGFALKFWRALRDGNLDLALCEMQSYFASIPYVEGFKEKLKEAATAEGFYEYTMYLVFSMLNVYVRTQVKVAGGRVDMVVWMPDVTYVFELKKSGTAQQALEQIDSHSYALPYKAEGRRVVKVGVKFDPETRVPESWVIAE